MRCTLSGGVVGRSSLMGSGPIIPTNRYTWGLSWPIAWPMLGKKPWKWALRSHDEPDRDRALALRPAWIDGACELVVPSLWPFEVGNVLGLKAPAMSGALLQAMGDLSDALMRNGQTAAEAAGSCVTPPGRGGSVPACRLSLSEGRRCAAASSDPTPWRRRRPRCRR